MRNETTKKICVLAVMSALAFLVMVVIKIPIVMFLKYEPKDVIIAIAGFIYGPLASFAVSLVVAFVEMVTVSDTGPIGMLMNLISSCTFACTAAIIYKKNRNLKGAVIGLITGVVLTTGIMVMWNYLITPIFMDVPRKDVVALLLPTIVPFNVLKYGLNSALIMLLYKPVKKALERSRLMPAQETLGEEKGKANVGVIVVSIFVIATCVLWVFVLQGKL